MHKKLKTYAKTLTLFSALSTLAICIYAFSANYTAAAIATIVWFVSPYAYLAFLINLLATKHTTLAAMTISVATCFYGLFTLIDAVFIHPITDATTIHVNSPLWQWAILLILTLPLTLLNKFKNT